MSKLTKEEVDELLSILQKRFEKNMHRHKGIKWADVLARLQQFPAKIWTLNEMEATGGEPDVISYDARTGSYIFFDCSPESPKGRRSICYDQDALHSRKEHKPANSAINMAAEMGVEILTEEQYRALQATGTFDIKTSSWVKTPDDIRKLGGAVFCDRRFNTVFLYHNGAESYYGSRGFRGALTI